MQAVLLIDFGSTWTKVTAVDLDTQSIIDTAQAFTTVEEDINIGLDNAKRALFAKTGELDFVDLQACSSAAGGLRMMVSGLVPELTAEAARLAALGAGAKIIKVFSHGLTKRDLKLIETEKPDIFLLVGGTDGGNTECITGNAEKLASLNVRFPVIYAGNRDAFDDCEESLTDFELHVCGNVMPRFGELVIDNVQSTIRDIFLKRIVEAKGLSKAKSLISNIMMPTPAAVLSAMQLLADGTKKSSGIGSIIGVDVGGATTDVYSIADGAPESLNIMLKGFNEPYAKRTVEGDIGMRYSLYGVIEACGEDNIAEDAGLTAEEAKDIAAKLYDNKSLVPDADAKMQNFDLAVARGAVDVATKRHAGNIEEVYTTSGLAYVQQGKDLRHVSQVILTGGSLIHAKNPQKIAEHAMFAPEAPKSLRPYKARVLLDNRYILASMGVLAQKHPEIALKIMKDNLQFLGEIDRTPVQKEEKVAFTPC